MWRKLRRLGVAQLLDGLVALPLDARTREQLEWVADEIVDAGGEATVWFGRVGSKIQEREIARSMQQTVAAEYDAVIDEANRSAGLPETDRRRVHARLRRELQRIAGRDHFPPAEREIARRAVRELGARMGVAP